MKLDNNLRRCRFDWDTISQEALAKELGVTRQTIISIEKCRFMPSTLLAIRIAQFFNKSVEEIFYIVDENKKQNS